MSDHTRVPDNYPQLLDSIKARIRQERLRVVMSANAAMVLLYWDIGTVILARQEKDGWGSKVIERLSTDLHREFPEMKGLSTRNLKYMRAFAAAWSNRAFVQEALAQTPWYHHLALLEKVRDPDIRVWYAQKSVENGWSRNILALQIDTRLHERQGHAIHNFTATLPPAHSDMAGQIFKDPYLFDFLGTADLRREAEVEAALTERVQRFLLELGAGFAFVGRQVKVEVGGDDFYIDLLFYHLKLRRFVVVELKAVPFEPEFTGKLGFYVTAVDRQLRHPSDEPTIGLLLCRGKNRVQVEYALSGVQKPMGVADWETALMRSIPEDLRSSLPTVEELEAELGVPEDP